ncbi:TonB-dependent receptor plug domain-containing protein [Alicycliphilus denitrificans]|uniref:TonB-dependent receptor plug domain-containing protein n=1 Tax=Alicycliphilus denitrificans TaxID=179636 RepID=UPI003850C8B2
MHMKDCLAAALALAGMAAQPLWARGSLEADAQRLMSLSLQDLIATPVVTASRQEERRDQTPAQILVITREQIRERRYQSLADLMQDLPGMDWQGGTKSSQFNQFAVQGHVGPSKLLILMDGVRIGQPAGGNFPVASNLALYMAKQVEVLYGPAAALYGADAVAGVINIITEAGKGPRGSWAALGAGRFGAEKGAFLTGLDTVQGLHLSLGGHWQSADRAPLDRYYPREFAKVPAVGNGQTLIPADLREPYVGSTASHSLYARADWAEQFTVGFLRHSFTSLTSTGDPPAMARYQTSSEWQPRSDTLYGRWRFQPAPQMQAQLLVDHSRMQVDPRARYNNTFSNYRDSFSYVLGKRSGIEQSLQWRINGQQQLQAGLGWQKYYAVETAGLPAPYDTGKPAHGQGLLYPNTTLPVQIHDAAFRNLSAYAQLQSQWSEAFSTSAGVRLDRHSHYGNAVNPRLGAVYKPQERHVFKLLYGEAFRAPSPEESLSAFGSFSGAQDAQGNYIGTNFRVPNFNLNPEKARTVSAAWDWRPRPSLNLVTHVYLSRITNLVVTQGSDNVNALPGAILVGPETKGNAGRQQQQGLDLSAQWRFRISGDWAGDLWGSASWIHGRIDEGTGVDWDIPYVARHKLKLGATLRWRDQFSITPRIYWTGDVTNGRKQAPADPLLPQGACQGAMTAPARCSTPGYTLVDLHLGWHRLLGGRATLWLDLYNLLDRRYYAAGGAGSRTFLDMPQQPRTWMVTLDYRF